MRDESSCGIANRPSTTLSIPLSNPEEVAIELAVVVPTYNERGNVSPLLAVAGGAWV